MRGYQYKLIALAKNEYDHNHIIGKFKRQYYAERCMNLMVEAQKDWSTQIHYQVTFKNKVICYR